MPALLDFAASIGLPWSRDERFYTATVLPQIICRDEFRYLDPFLQVVDKDRNWPEIKSGQSLVNIQIFTEYNPQKALIGVVDGRFGNIKGHKDTPDLLLFIEKPDEQNILLAIEAKLYDCPTPDKIKKQINAQRIALEPLCTVLKAELISRVLLVGKSTENWPEDHGLEIITWEDILSAYRDDDEVTNGYFFRLLDEAVGAWKDLNTRVFLGTHNKKKMTGKDIYDTVKSNLDGALAQGFMGRQGGIEGAMMKADFANIGRWETQSYETNEEIKSPPNRYWFPVKDFIALIDARGSE